MSWIRFLPAELAHELAPLGLRLYADLTALKTQTTYEWKPFTWRGLRFRNPLGVAGGLDKNGECVDTWPKLGAGFAEIGTVTPRPQGPNPGKILARDWHNQTLWNQMGFPSAGAQDVASELAHSMSALPRFINIGKNRETPISKATDDYLDCVKILRPYASTFVINVSSPNTKGLRDLQLPEVLNQLCREVVAASGKIPVLVKLSPDMPDNELIASVDVARSAGISGFILTNTTLSRPAGSNYPDTGGLSGKALAEKSKHCLHLVRQHLGERKDDLLLVSAGGVLSAEDVGERLSLGADLVQVYSALVLNGPCFFRQVSQHFQAGVTK